MLAWAPDGEEPVVVDRVCINASEYSRAGRLRAGGGNRRPPADRLVDHSLRGGRLTLTGAVSPRRTRTVVENGT